MTDLFLTNISLGFILMVVFLIMKAFPPKNPNSFYGYRTKRSMKTRSSWKLANEYFSGGGIILGSVSVIIGLLTTFTVAKYSTPITAGSTITLLIGLYFKTEQTLD